MAETKKPTNRERLQEITAGIEQGIKELFESDRYTAYLRTMSRFHHYSVNNQMLIHMQKPDATIVAGFNKWRDQFERHVRKGEKGIKIIAPTPFKKKFEEQKYDPDTMLPVLDKDGKAVMEEKEVEIPMFRPVTVFDVSQTEGKPLPHLAADLHGDVKQYEVFLEALRRAAPVPVEFRPMKPEMDGYFDQDAQRIAIREGMSQVQTVSAAVHEITHASSTTMKRRGWKPPRETKPRNRPPPRTGPPRRWRRKASPTPSASITASRPARTALVTLPPGARGRSCQSCGPPSKPSTRPPPASSQI